ncbi:MAG: hypothetical protein IKS32_05180 [Solobacterium sp.]|nr:hypothetical protein [Solobacterium sp.]
MSVYLIIAMAFFLTGAYQAYRNRFDLHRVSLITTAQVGIAISILALPYFFRTAANPLFAVLASLRYGTTALAMNVNSEIIPALNLTGWVAVVYPSFLYALYILGPISASIALLGFSRSIAEFLRFGLHRKVHIFSQLNEKSAMIASTLYKENPHELRVFCASDNASDELKAIASQSHCLMVRAREDEIHAHRGYHYSIYEIYDDPVHSLKMASAVYRKFARKNADIMMRVFVTSDQKELIRDMDAGFRNQKSSIHIRYIDENTACSTELVTTVLPQLHFHPGRMNFSFLFVGCGDTGRELVRTFSWLMILPETSYTFHIVDPNAMNIASAMKAESPEFLNAPIEAYFRDDAEGKNYNIVFHAMKAEQTDFDQLLGSIQRPQAVFITTPDDNLNHSCAKKIERFYAASDCDLNSPAIALRLRSEELTGLIRSSDSFIYFGSLKSCYSYRNIIHPQLEEAARNVHYVYYGIHTMQEGSEEYRTAVERADADFYSYVNYSSSFAQALASIARKKYILASCPACTSETEWISEKLADEAYVMRLAEAEHDRWNAWQRVIGWRTATLKQAERIAEKSGGKQVKNDELMLHPAIVPYSELKQTEEAVDRILKKYNPDSRGCGYIMSDIMIVRALPQILPEERN